MAKTLSFGIMHVAIAFGVTYALTGNLAVSGAVTFIEPTVNTVAHYFFDRYWERREPGVKHKTPPQSGRGGDDLPLAA